MTICACCARMFDSARPHAKYCSGACRAAAHRDRQAAHGQKFMNDMAQLLRDQSDALRAGGDPVALADLERRAARLLGDVVNRYE